MAKKIYIGNLSYSTTEDTLRNQFSQFGQVESVSIIMDKFTNKSKGFGFVEMTDEKEADDAIATLNQKEIDGRKVRVSVAEEKALSDMGTASWNGTTGIECVNYFFTIPKGELENGLDFWNNAIRFPLMDKEEFEVEKKVVISEIQGNVSDPDRYISVYAQKKLFPKAPWQLDPSGSVKNVENATVEQLKEIQKHYYIPENAALFVGGDVSHEEGF